MAIAMPTAMPRKMRIGKYPASSSCMNLSGGDFRGRERLRVPAHVTDPICRHKPSRGCVRRVGPRAL